VLEVSDARAGLKVFGSERISIERWPPVTGFLGARCNEATAPREHPARTMAIAKTKTVLLKKDGNNTITFWLEPEQCQERSLRVQELLARLSSAHQA
jgi:hypothetical protein